MIRLVVFFGFFSGFRQNPKLFSRMNVHIRNIIEQQERHETGERLYESSRAVTMVDGSPPATSLAQLGLKIFRAVRSQKSRFLGFCEFVWARTNFLTFLRSRPIQKCIRCVQGSVWENLLGENMFSHDTEKSEFFFSKILLFVKSLWMLPGSF